MSEPFAEQVIDDRRGLRAPGTGSMVAGSLVGAIAAYLFQVVVGNGLGAEAFAPIGVLWTLVFILLTVVFVPLEQFVTREASRRSGDVLRADAKVIALVSLMAAGIGAGFATVTVDDLFAGSAVYVAIIATTLVAYGLFFSVKGLLAGRRQFAGVGVLLAVEGTVRVVVAALLLTVTRQAEVVAWSMLTGPLAVLITPALYRSRRQAPGERRETVASTFLGGYVVGSAASQVLLASAPVVVAFLGGSAALVSVIFVTFTLYRAPLTLIYALQGRLLAVFVRWVDAGHWRELRRAAALLGAGGLVLVGLAWPVGLIIGPEVVELLFDAEFVPAATVAAWVASGVIAGSAAQVLGQMLVAEGRTPVLARSWMLGLGVAAVGLVAFGAAPDVRVSFAFALGELTAFAGVGVAVLRSLRRRVHVPPADAPDAAAGETG